MAGYIATSKKTDWNTPNYLLDYCREVIQSEFSLDPCSNSGSLVRADRSIILPEDGLSINWLTYSSIFINPPFGRDKVRGTSAKDWVSKASATYTLSSGSCAHIFILIPAAVDTRLWQDIIFKDRWGPEAGGSLNSICFIKGRIKFEGAEAHCPMPMAMVYYGRLQDRFKQIFSNIGYVI